MISSILGHLSIKFRIILFRFILPKLPKTLKCWYILLALCGCVRMQPVRRLREIHWQP